MLNTNIRQPLAKNHDDTASADGAIRPPDAQYRAKVGKVADEFEALFIRTMLGQMRQATREVAGKDSIFAQSINSDMIDFADMAVADQLAKQHLFGIANAVLAQLLPNDSKNNSLPLKNNHTTVASVSYTEPEIGAGLTAFATPPFYLPHHK